MFVSICSVSETECAENAKVDEIVAGICILMGWHNTQETTGVSFLAAIRARGTVKGRVRACGRLNTLHKDVRMASPRRWQLNEAWVMRGLRHLIRFTVWSPREWSRWRTDIWKSSLWTQHWKPGQSQLGYRVRVESWSLSLSYVCQQCLWESYFCGEVRRKA